MGVGCHISRSRWKRLKILQSSHIQSLAINTDFFELIYSLNSFIANSHNHIVKLPESHHRLAGKSEWLCKLSECLYVWTFKLQTELWIWLWIVSEILILSRITASGDLPEEKWKKGEERRCWEVSTVGKEDESVFMWEERYISMDVKFNSFTKYP